MFWYIYDSIFSEVLLFRYGPNGTETPPNDHDFYDHCQIVHDLQVNFKWGRKVHNLDYLILMSYCSEFFRIVRLLPTLMKKNICQVTLILWSKLNLALQHPGADLGYDDLMEWFANEFGFNPRQVTFDYKIYALARISGNCFNGCSYSW